MRGRQAEVGVVGHGRGDREGVRAPETMEAGRGFLDVRVAGHDGVGVIRARGAGRMPAVVFVTAHDEFAVRAFETNALDYLVKPLSRARFDATVRRVRERLSHPGSGATASQLSAAIGLAAPPPAHTEGFVVSTPTGQLVLDAGEISWIEARDYNAGVHAGGTCHLIRESLRSLERRLGSAGFLRVHRGAIVRLSQVREVRALSGGRAIVVLEDGVRIRVSRRRAKRLRSALRPGNR